MQAAPAERACSGEEPPSARARRDGMGVDVICSLDSRAASRRRRETPHDRATRRTRHVFPVMEK